MLNDKYKQMNTLIKKEDETLTEEEKLKKFNKIIKGMRKSNLYDFTIIDSKPEELKSKDNKIKLELQTPQDIFSDSDSDKSKSSGNSFEESSSESINLNQTLDKMLPSLNQIKFKDN